MINRKNELKQFRRNLVQSAYIFWFFSAIFMTIFNQHLGNLMVFIGAPILLIVYVCLSISEKPNPRKGV